MKHMNVLAETIGPKGYGVYRAQWYQGQLLLEPSEGQPEVWITPGFVDIHLHGAFGIDFMDATPEQLHTLSKGLEEHGYEAFMATTVTAPPQAVLRALYNLAEYQEQAKNSPSGAEILGVHVEGPFISPLYPGAQPPEFIIEPPTKNSIWDRILEHPLVKIITLAPEVPHALPLISRLRKQGVIVSMGHSNATYSEAHRAFEVGVRHTTHTFNAMRPFHHREAGLTGYALLKPEVITELIYDRIHVGYEAAKLLIQSKPQSALIAVSDSTLATGLQPGLDVTMWGHECYTKEDRVCLKHNNALAGSTLTLMNAYKNLASDFGSEIAMRMCSWNPRQALGFRKAPRLWLVFDKRLECIERIRTPSLTSF
jgi:N-acetylglucosamine-6-phosphate deacetylase